MNLKSAGKQPTKVERYADQAFRSIVAVSKTMREAAADISAETDRLKVWWFAALARDLLVAASYGRLVGLQDKPTERGVPAKGPLNYLSPSIGMPKAKATRFSKLK